MSSSDEEAEFLEASPVEPVTRRGNRRKANSPSPKKIPRKKQREVLSDFNVELEDSDEEEEEEQHGGRRNPRGVHQVKRKRGELTSSDSNVEEEEDGRRSTSSEMENRPPPSSKVASLADEIPEESSQPNNGDAQARSRKRLSIRAELPPDGRRSSVSSGSGVETVVATPGEVHTIYETCSQLFNANRINPQNAFNLRLLDCINQMINSPGYDKSNMQLTSSTVEIGAKIYVCRVDNTHSQVLSLASDISLQQRRKKKDGHAEAENQDDNEGGRVEGEEDIFGDDEGHTGRRQKQKRKVVKKRGRFVEADNGKLLTGLEEQNVKFVTRRTLLKRKFNQMIYEDLEFEYLSYFLEPEDEHPLHTKKETEDLKHQFKISEVYTNATEMGKLEFLPFSHLPKFDPETHDVWGRPLHEAEEMRHHIFQEPQGLANDEFAYDPADRPAEYPDEGGPDHDNMMNDTLGEALPHEGDDGGREIPPVSFHDIRSLDHLDDYFQKVRNLLKVSKSKYGWCGPNFARPKATWTAQKGPKKPRVRKEPERVEFATLEWNDKANRYNTTKPGRTIYDDKIVESWSLKKTAIPFLGIEITSYDDDFDPLDFQNENDPKFVPTIFKFFTRRNRSILDLFKTSVRRRYSSNGSLPPPHLGDDGFDNDNDIELPRDIVEDFCSQQTNEDGYNPARPDGATPGDAGWQFPSSVPGLLNEDPLSHVSGIDSIRFSKKPKPIDMSQLKKAILKTLMTTLNLHGETAEPQDEKETTINLADLMLQVLKKLDTRTEKLLSVPIFIVALMHVVADRRLFVLYDESDPSCPVVLCRGKNFNHADHIPMPVDGLDCE